MTRYTLAQLLEIMARLRDPKTGCPWDRAQNFASIVPHTLEEAHEVADTIERGAFNELKDELGDLLFQIVFYAQLAKEQQLFDFDDVVSALGDKLTRRHPDIFPQQHTQPQPSQPAPKQTWEQRKTAERQQQKPQQHALLGDIVASLPALSRANKIQKRVASIGFDWADVSGALDKVREEVDEVSEAIYHDPHSEHTAEEIGDLLFATVNVARHVKRDPEQLLRQANSKFCQRFLAVEAHLARQGITLAQASLEQMDDAWEAIKKAQ